MRHRYLTIGLSTLALITLGFAMLQPPSERTLLARYNLQDLSVQEKIDYLEASVEDSNKVSASVTPSSLVLTLEGRQFVYPLPDNQFYLSIAPYINQTHPCGTHSLVSCRGELVNTTFDVRIESSELGVIIEDQITSHSNGFFGVWLPKNEQLSITITYLGMRASTVLSTSDENNTCLTTMRLLPL